MPVWLQIVLLVIVGTLVLLVVGGAIATSARTKRSGPAIDASVAALNRELANAHAEDRGWARDVLERAARDAFANERPGVEPEVFELVQIVDLPGTEQDKAIFRVVAGGTEAQLTLGRHEGAWVGESFS